MVGLLKSPSLSLSKLFRISRYKYYQEHPHIYNHLRYNTYKQSNIFNILIFNTSPQQPCCWVLQINQHKMHCEPFHLYFLNNPWVILRIPIFLQLELQSLQTHVHAMFISQHFLLLFLKDKQIFFKNLSKKYNTLATGKCIFHKNEYETSN